MSFQVGDRVRLNPSSGYFTKDNSDDINPTDVFGTVESVTGGKLSYIVSWDAGKHSEITNAYRNEDLLHSEENMEEVVESWEMMAHPLKITKQGKVRWNYPDGGVGTFDIRALANRAGSVNLQKIAALIMAYADQMLDEEAGADKGREESFDDGLF